MPQISLASTCLMREKPPTAGRMHCQQAVHENIGTLDMTRIGTLVVPTVVVASAMAVACVLPEPVKPFDVRYPFGGQEHTLSEFVPRTDTTALLMLKNNQILFEGYDQRACPKDALISFSVDRIHVTDQVCVLV